MLFICLFRTSGFYFCLSLPECSRKTTTPMTGCVIIPPPTLCVFNLCIIVSYDILNQAPLVPSCYQQLMPKILIYNTSQHASESPSNHSRPISSHCSFSSLHIIRQKECKTRGDLLENNALGKCCKTFESLFVKVVRLVLL